MSEIKIPKIIEDVTVLSGDEPGVHFDKETNTYYMHPKFMRGFYERLSTHICTQMIPRLHRPKKHCVITYYGEN